MILGRFVLGIGAPSLIVTTSCLITKWFLGKELGLALGINTGVSRVGAAIVGVVIPPIYAATEYRGDEYAFGLTSLIAFFFSCLGMVCMIVAACLDSYSDKVDGAPE